MNYLVHLYLAGEDPELQLGGILGDFVKGLIPADYPEKRALGLHLHRRIDTLSQNSLYTRQSRKRLRPGFGHGRGIIIDIFYDHFLATAWPEYSQEPLSDYANKIYQLLKKNHHQLPEKLRQIVPHMEQDNWLVSYQQRFVVEKVLNRIAQRLSRPLPLSDAIADLTLHETLLRQDFTHFMAEAQTFIKNELKHPPF